MAKLNSKKKEKNYVFTKEKNLVGSTPGLDFQLCTFGTGYGSTFLPPSSKSLGPAFSRSEMKIRNTFDSGLGNVSYL